MYLANAFSHILYILHMIVTHHLLSNPQLQDLKSKSRVSLKLTRKGPQQKCYVSHGGPE